MAESVGDCCDNAIYESFFATLECESLERCLSPSQAEARMAIFDFIAEWYNPRLLHFAFGYLSLQDYERNHHLIPVRPNP